MERPRWEYRTIELKTHDGRAYDPRELERLGEDGWEAVAFLPLPKPDPKGAFGTTKGYLLLKRVRGRA